MRPIILKLQAFGSYGKETVIDFGKPAQNLFLITGNTGAGKTTIFDAMVYALYGEVSSAGNQKEGLVLQSQFGYMEETPFVELTFSEITNGDENIFIVNRTPRHKRKKKRGAGYTEAGGTVSLILPDGSEYPQKEADKKIQEIVGLTKEQFMQVAMIAQGEFMELLQASSDKKKKIFQRLFNTSFYQRIIDELSNRRKILEKDLETFHNKSQVVTGSVTVPEEYADKEMIQELIQRITEEKKGNTLLMEELLPVLDKLLVWQNSRYEKAALEKEHLQKVRDTARDNCTDANTLLTSFQQLEEAQIKIVMLDKEKQNMENQFVLCQQLKTAYDLQQLWEPYESAEKDVAETVKVLQEQRETLPILQKDVAEIRKEKETITKQKEVALKEYTRQKEKCHRGIEILTEIETKEDEIQIKRNAFIKVEENEKEVNQEFVNLEQQEIRWKEVQKKLENAPILLEQWNNKWEDYELAKASLNEIEKLEEQYQKVREAVETKKRKYEACKKIYRQRREDYDRESQKFLDNQAGYIAKKYLKEGEACPVCGSLEHPSPCVMAEEKILDRKEIEDLKSRLDTAHANRETASQEAREQKQKLDSLEEKIRDTVGNVRKKLEKYIDPFPAAGTAGDFVPVVTAWKEALTEEGEQKKEDDRKRKEAKIFLEHLDSQKENLRNSIKKAVKEREEKQQIFEVAKGQLEQLEKQRPFYSREDAANVLKQAETKKQEIDEKEAAISNKLTTLENDILKSETLLQECSSKLPKQEYKRNVLLEKYENRLRQSTFLPESLTNKSLTQPAISQEQWMELVENHEKEEIDKIEEAESQYRQDRITAETQKATAEEALKGKEKPDIDALTQIYTRADEKLTVAKNKEETLKKETENNTQAYEKLQEYMQDSSQIIENHRLVNGMYTRLSGNVTGARMDIETFVQRYYLEHILDAANARFEDMSAGQFQLQMMDIEEAAVGKNKGLDLMVYSTVTGKKRPVGTLSGGESFMAALSLALGMADEITRRSAAINLDVMFIDEGFGSLDDHSRSQAVKVLRQMAGGTKLVGIISHVSELKQEIDDQLLVSKDQEGSHARWQLS